MEERAGLCLQPQGRLSGTQEEEAAESRLKHEQPRVNVKEGFRY